MGPARPCRLSSEATEPRAHRAGTAKRAEDYPEGNFRRGDPRFQRDNFEPNVRAADPVCEIATATGGKPGKVALAWLLHKGDEIVPIPGTKRRAYLEENVAAADIRLDSDHMSRLDQALRREAVSGPRYNKRQMAMVDR